MGVTADRKLVGEQAHKVELYIRRGELPGEHELIDIERNRQFAGTTAECLIYLRGRMDERIAKTFEEL